MTESSRTRHSGDQLTRLRRQINGLRREVQDLETRMANSAATARETESRLRDELETIKASRSWQFARGLACLRQALTLDGLRSWLGRGPRMAGEEPAHWRARRYDDYVAAHAVSGPERERLRARVASLPRQPLISVIMPVHNVAADLLNAAVESVRAQIYTNWELCIVDDGSGRPDTVKALAGLAQSGIRLERCEPGVGIAAATNHAIGMARGGYLAFMDHDDVLAPDALGEVVLEINASDADFIYSDEDCLDRLGHRINPHFKPDFSPDLLLSHNYITHLVVVRRNLLEDVGGLLSEFDGAQDYDFVLRATEQARCIRHVPKVLYHWRMSDSSTSARADSKPQALERGRLALARALARRGRDGQALVDPVSPHFYRVRYAVRGRPRVSILIPFRDRPSLLHGVIGDILEKSGYQNFEIVGINNRSEEPGTFDAMRDLAALDDRVRFIDDDGPFNFSAIMNRGAQACTGEHLLFLNNDIRFPDGEWVSAMLEHSQRSEVGAVGGKLLYPDGRTQHAGIIIGIDGYAGHSHKGFDADHRGYFNRLKVVQNVSAVTAAFMMVEKTLFDSVDGFDATHFAVACNDVDLCLRLRERGLWNVFTPYAQACHVESASRGYEDSAEKQARFAAEKAEFARRHRQVLDQGDPFYNPNLTRDAEDFSIRLDAEAQ